MILTNCAVCAAPLGLTLGKKCGRCSTRYCGPECQVQHWKEGGHDQLCRPIKKAGGAEQYHANKKYAEAVAVAVAKCADDTKGQTCYICTEAVHRHTGEGLVRGCACHTTEGFVHVSCLAEQAKILVAEAKENNLDLKVQNERWNRWYTCSLCKQGYHGVVRCALGWACWKTYVGRPEAHQIRSVAMSLLGLGLHDAEHYEDALSVREAEMAWMRRLGASAKNILAVQNNLAITYGRLGRLEEALQMQRNVYSGHVKLNGEEDPRTLQAALNYAASFVNLGRLKETKSLLRKVIPVAQRVFGESHDNVLRMKWNYALALYKDAGATLDDCREAVTTLEDAQRIARRVMGGAHPLAVGFEGSLREARAALATREGDDVSSVCDGVAAMTPGGA
jgi:tetratricopeptide (TPR) repeat protein